jgi:hypothetical protein
MSDKSVRAGGEGFNVNDVVLCYHSGLLYKAKILKKAEKSEKDAHYFIHYPGKGFPWTP